MVALIAGLQSFAAAPSQNAGLCFLRYHFLLLVKNIG
jgi:hypothetical protein